MIPLEIQSSKIPALRTSSRSLHHSHSEALSENLFIRALPVSTMGLFLCSLMGFLAPGGEGLVDH